MHRRIVAIVLFGAAAGVAAAPPSEVLSNDENYRLSVSFEPRLGFGADLSARVRLQCVEQNDCRTRGLVFGAIMPEHGHGLSYSPRVEAVGENEYLVRGLRFHMRGYWQVHLDVLTDTGMERAQFDVEL